jgi:PHD/YefM family antitoxin component YafN of YafNO toxin-antitoxin module
MATAAANQTQTQRPASRLAKVTKGRLRTPNTIIIYGPEGVGKSTLALSAPGVIMFDVEDGSSEIEARRYPFTDHPEKGHVPPNYQAVLDAIDDLTVSEHDYKTLVIDSADRLEAMIWKHMLARDSEPGARNPKNAVLTSIEDYGYGKGYHPGRRGVARRCAPRSSTGCG